MNPNPHYLADAFKFSLDATARRTFTFNAMFQNLAIIVIGGVLAFFWHPAALAICAWGVYGAVANAYADTARHIIAVNDSLIALDNQRAAEFQRLYDEISQANRRLP